MTSSTRFALSYLSGGGVESSRTTLILLLLHVPSAGDFPLLEAVDERLVDFADFSTLSNMVLATEGRRSCWAISVFAEDAFLIVTSF